MPVHKNGTWYGLSSHAALIIKGDELVQNQRLLKIGPNVYYILSKLSTRSEQPTLECTITEKQLFVLNFRGLSFCFPVESKFQPGYAHGLGSLQFPNGSSPVVSRMSIYTGNNVCESGSPPLPLCCYNNHLYMDRVEVIRERHCTKGIRLHLFTEGSSRLLEPRKQSLCREIMFGDTCQDVVTSLGAPSRVFYKAEDKMKIHSPNAHRRVATRRSDFFFNYFTLGMISAYTKWDTISEQLKPSERPVVLNRASSTNTTNPFGSTFCYGYQDIIFEVMPNNYIASMTLYTGERLTPGV
uniref:Uncharacterized protein n=1 Tax=Timema genevievae TaxID=629358 RepID=A0A7R9JT06_TIMGE|nr:unnamed protein product [Timema genevievae]